MWTTIALAGALGTGPAGDAAPSPRLASPPAPVASPFGETPGPSPYRLRRGEGRGMVIAGAVLAGLSHVWLAAAETAAAPSFAYDIRLCTTTSPDYDRNLCMENSDDDIWFIMVALVRPPAMALRLVGLSLLGAGLSRHGRAVRRRGLAASRRSLAKQRTRRRWGLGLLAAGGVLTLLDATLALSAVCWSVRDSIACHHGMHYATLTASSAMIGAGLALGPYADGYLREDARLRSVRVAPLGLPGGAGLVVGGRF